MNQAGGLAERLKRLRQDAGLTGDRLAELAGWPRSKVPKLEGGRQLPTQDDIRTWTRLTGADDQAPTLLDLRAEADTVRKQWRHRTKTGQAGLQVEFDTLVREAAQIRNFEVTFIPGLLQTAGYARYRSLEAVRVHGFRAEDIDAAVQARMDRQRVLYDTAKTFEFVVTEAAFRLLPCPRPVMLGQLDRLVTASTLENVTLGIVPFDVELSVAPVVGFLAVDDVTIVETVTGEDTISAEESARYAQVFDLLMGEARTGDEARQLIAAAAAGLRRVAG